MSILAQDRRTIDQDGRLHAPGSRISKATVNPYFGREIPGYEALGLNPNRVYMMYRTPELLQRAAASFENVPLVVGHHMVSADEFPADRVGGTVSNPRFEYPYLVADVTAWTRGAIDGIENGEQKELSCAYRYSASMISGTSPDGVRYDGTMNPPADGVGAANHVALVAVGRAGPDVVVADRMPSTMKRPKILSALAAILGVVAQPSAEQLLALDGALDEELTAADADLDDDEKKAAKDAMLKELGKDALSDEEESEAYKRAAKDKAQRGAAGAKTPAQDEAAIKLAVDAAIATARDGYVLQADADKMAADAAAAARAETIALYDAREAVSAKVGAVALDSAEAVYRFALDKLDIPHKDVPAAALPALYVAGTKTAAIVQDAGIKVPNIIDLIPNLTNIRRS